MSYATNGLGSVEVSGVLSTASLQAKATSRNFAVQAGVPGEIFDTFDELTSGASLSFDTKSVTNLNLLMSKGISLAHGVATQLGGTQAIADATRLPPGTIDVVLGIATGGRPDVGQIASVIGAAAGTAICGPLCGAAGAMVGTLAVEVVGSFGVDMGSLFGGESQAKMAFDHAVAVQGEVAEIQMMLLRFTGSVVQSLYYGLARIYNQLLSLGVQDFDPATVVSMALGPQPDRFSYVQAHGGLQPEELDLAQAQKKFVDQVFYAANTRFNGLWDRNAVESGFTSDVKPWLYGGDEPRREQVHPGGANVWCTFRDAGFPNVPDDPAVATNNNHYGNQFGGPNSATKGYPPDVYLARWQCDNKSVGPGGQHYRDWLRGKVDGYGKVWGAIASRDCAILQLKGSLDKAKAAQVVSQAEQNLKAAQARVQAIANEMVAREKDVVAHDQLTQAKATADAALNQASLVVAQQAQQSYGASVTAFQNAQTLQAQMLQSQVTSRNTILKLQGKWTTETKVLVASGVGLLLAGVGAGGLFWSRHRRRLAT